MGESTARTVPVLFRVRPEALNALMRMWSRDSDGSRDTDTLKAYLGEVLLRCLTIVVKPEDERSSEERQFLAEVGKELKDSVSVTTEEGLEILFRFL